MSVTILGTSTLSQVSALTTPATLAHPVSRLSSSDVRGDTRMNGATWPLTIIGVSCVCTSRLPNQAFAVPGKPASNSTTGNFLPRYAGW